MIYRARGDLQGGYRSSVRREGWAPSWRGYSRVGAAVDGALDGDAS